MNHERLWTLGNKLRAAEGRGVGDQDRPVRPVKGIKEGMYCMEHWVLYATNEASKFKKKKKELAGREEVNLLR